MSPWPLPNASGRGAATERGGFVAGGVSVGGWEVGMVVEGMGTADGGGGGRGAIGRCCDEPEPCVGSPN